MKNEYIIYKYVRLYVIYIYTCSSSYWLCLGLSFSLLPADRRLVSITSMLGELITGGGGRLPLVPPLKPWLLCPLMLPPFVPLPFGPWGSQPATGAVGTWRKKNILNIFYNGLISIYILFLWEIVELGYLQDRPYFISYNWLQI